MLATDLAACVALGKPWLGSPVTQAPVIFVDEEAGFRRLWVRLNAALVTHAAPKGTPLHYISYGRYDFRDLKDCDELGMDAFHMQVGLIVIDALADVMGVGDENNVITMHAVLRNLRRLAHMAQAAILVVHHTNKSGTFRGSSAIAAGVDHMLRITSPVDESLIKLRTIKSRDINPVKIDARSSFNDGRFAIESVPYNGTSDLPGGFSLSPTALAILSHYRKGIVLSATTKDMLAAAPPNVSRLSARRVIYDLIESELILRVNSGGQGRKANYMISIKGRELLERLAKNNSQAA